MHTALAVRECVVKLINLLNYIIFFSQPAGHRRLGLLEVGDAFGSLNSVLHIAVILLHSTSQQRLLISRLRTLSNWILSLTDSYTKIQTVRLIYIPSAAPSTRQIYHMHKQQSTRSIQLVTSLYDVAYLLNSILLLSVGSLSISMWPKDSVTICAVAILLGLVLKLCGMSQCIM